MSEEDEDPVLIIGKRYDSIEEMLADIDESWRRTPWWCKAWYWICRKLSNAKWAILWRFHPSHRYNIVRTGLPPRYYDADSRLEAAMITIFKQFIEIEKPFEVTDTEDPMHKAEWDRVKALYAKLKDYDVTNPPYQQALEAPYKMGDGKDHEKHAEAFRESNRLRDDLTETLCELVRLHSHFWT